MEFRRFIKEHILFAILSVIVFLFYRQIIGEFATLVVLCILFAYGSAMAACHFAMTKLDRLEKTDSVTTKSLFELSPIIASPIYLLWLIFSLIPILSYEVWLITGLPITGIAVLALQSIAEHWEKPWRVVFWLMQILIYLCLLFAGQSVVSLLPF
ncbi:MAG: hypothetical protein J6B71_08860 [Clostridia bacterium]|nr:hypothetical protein [Clostridia bacterium]